MAENKISKTETRINEALDVSKQLSARFGFYENKIEAIFVAPSIWEELSVLSPNHKLSQDSTWMNNCRAIPISPYKIVASRVRGVTIKTSLGLNIHIPIPAE